MAAFWLVLSGNADYQPSPGYGERRHFLGPAKAPIWIGYKRDVPGLLTEEFWRCFTAWRIYRIGGGFPESGPWPEQDPIIVESILAFEELYKRHFSAEKYVADALGAIIKLLSGKRRRI